MSNYISFQLVNWLSQLQLKILISGLIIHQKINDQAIPRKDCLVFNVFCFCLFEIVIDWGNDIYCKNGSCFSKEVSMISTYFSSDWRYFLHVWSCRLLSEVNLLCFQVWEWNWFWCIGILIFSALHRYENMNERSLFIYKRWQNMCFKNRFLGMTCN